MTALAALSGSLPRMGVIAVATLLAVVLLARAPRVRAAAMAGAMILSPALLLAQIWSSPQLRVVHRHPGVGIVAAFVALAALGGLGLFVARRPAALALLAVGALPFRVPVAAGGATSNLLVPLYLVIGAGSLAFIVSVLRHGKDEKPGHEPGWIERLLALTVLLYGLQAVYSSDFQKALQQMVFFYVPFGLLFSLLAQIDWTPRLARRCVYLLGLLAIVFAGIGFVEYATKTILLNSKLVEQNELHAYFTVNSVFFDPDIFGRFLALVIIIIAWVLLYERPGREQLAAIGVLAVLWGGLVLTLSRSSLAALLVGLATLAALRWRVSRALAVVGVISAIGVVAVIVSPNTFGLNQGLNGASSGRANLISGGLSLFTDRPLWGYSSGSFVREYRAHHPGSVQTVSTSHTIAVTIAAEQGTIGELAYVPLVLVSVIVLLRGARADRARGAIGAAFLALMFHTLLYADFLEDPTTWALLGAATALLTRQPDQAVLPVPPRALTVAV